MRRLTSLHDHDNDIADTIHCSLRTNVLMFEGSGVPENAGDRRSCMLPHVLNALLDHLITKPEL